MQIDHSIHGTASIGRSLFPVGVAMALAAVAMTGLVLTVSVSALSRSDDAAEEGAVARCDRLAAVVTQGSAAKVDALTLRRQYEQAFRTCLSDVGAFQRSVGSR